MKKLVAAILLATAAPVWANCSYPLDGTQADLDATPFTQGFTKANVFNGQSMEVTVTGTSHTPYAALSHDGLVAMQQAYTTGVPMGDLQLPATGVVHVRMEIKDFPWGSFDGPNSAVGMFVSMLSGNHSGPSPLPKDAFQLNVGVMNTNNLASRVNLWVNAQSIDDTSFNSINSLDPAPMPFPADIVGFWIDMDTRQVGLSVRITETVPNLPPPGDYDLPALSGNQGPFLLPDGVTSVAIGMGAIVSQVPAADPLVGSILGATLLTDACGSSEPPPQTLPNGNPFPGKAAPKKFQGLPFPFVGKPPFAGTGNGNQ